MIPLPPENRLAHLLPVSHAADIVQRPIDFLWTGCSVVLLGSGTMSPSRKDGRTMLIADAATTVVQVVLIGGVIIVIAGLMWWGLRARTRNARVMRGPLFAVGDTIERPPG